MCGYDLRNGFNGAGQYSVSSISMIGFYLTHTYFSKFASDDFLYFYVFHFMFKEQFIPNISYNYR